MTGPVEIHAPLVPTLVSFDDLSDQKSAQVVYATENIETNDGRSGPRYVARVAADRLGDILGPGYSFGRATVEIVPYGIWPLNLMGITGVPVTRGIEQRVVGLKDMQRWIDVLRAQPFNRERVRVHPLNFSRDDW